MERELNHIAETLNVIANATSGGDQEEDRTVAQSLASIAGSLRVLTDSTDPEGIEQSLMRIAAAMEVGKVSEVAAAIDHCSIFLQDIRENIAAIPAREDEGKVTAGKY